MKLAPPDGMNKSPAEIAGIRKGDVIKTIKSMPMKTHKDVIMTLRSSQPGDTVPVTVEREGKEFTFNVILGFRYVNSYFYQLMPMTLTIDEVLYHEKKPMRLAVFP